MREGVKLALALLTKLVHNSSLTTNAVKKETQQGCLFLAAGQGAIGVAVQSRIVTKIGTRSSWLNCALRDDEAVYWVSIGH